MQHALNLSQRKKPIRTEIFLQEMTTAMPWDALVAAIQPHYHDPKTPGRKPHDLLLMLKIHMLQQWFSLSDPAMEEMIHDRLSFQQFLDVNLFCGDTVPDESSICRFRHILEKYNLADDLFTQMNDHLAKAGLILNTGTIVDATIIHAPKSTKNKAKKRDPEMSSTRKSNQWYFGAKGHVGVQSAGKSLIHSAEMTTAKTHDSRVMDGLLHGEESSIFGDKAYHSEGRKRDCRRRNIFYGITNKAKRGHPLSHKQGKHNRKMSGIRAKVEHPFRTIKVIFKQTKLRYRGLMKNSSWFKVLCGLQNIYLCRRELCGAVPMPVCAEGSRG